MGDWYYAESGLQAGPLTLDALRERARRGQLGRGDLVWTDGMDDWVPAARVADLFGHGPATVAKSVAPPPPPPRPLKAAAEAPPSVLPYDGSPVAPAALRYAALWRRLAAAIVDLTLLSVGLYLISQALFRAVGPAGATPGTPQRNVAKGLAQLALLLIIWLYFAGLESSALRATVGKLAVGIRVATANGGRVGFGRATGRCFAKFTVLFVGSLGAGIAGAIIGSAVAQGPSNGTLAPGVANFVLILMGVALAGCCAVQRFTLRRQAIHDLIAGTVVIRRPEA